MKIAFNISIIAFLIGALLAFLCLSGIVLNVVSFKEYTISFFSYVFLSFLSCLTGVVFLCVNTRKWCWFLLIVPITMFLVNQLASHHISSAKLIENERWKSPVKNSNIVFYTQSKSGRFNNYILVLEKKGAIPFVCYSATFKKPENLEVLSENNIQLFYKEGSSKRTMILDVNRYNDPDNVLDDI